MTILISIVHPSYGANWHPKFDVLKWHVPPDEDPLDVDEFPEEVEEVPDDEVVVEELPVEELDVPDALLDELLDDPVPEAAEPLPLDPEPVAPASPASCWAWLPQPAMPMTPSAVTRRTKRTSEWQRRWRYALRLTGRCSESLQSPIPPRCTSPGGALQGGSSRSSAHSPP
jgi:hypothetical protein